MVASGFFTLRWGFIISLISICWVWSVNDGQSLRMWSCVSGLSLHHLHFKSMWADRTCLRRIYLPFHNGVYLAIYTCLFRWCYGHFYNRLTQFIVYCSYVVCTILLRRPVDLSTHWTVTAISLHVTTFVGVCHE